MPASPAPGCARIWVRQADPIRKGFAVASTEVEHFTGVDTVEVPSAAWGWSRINHRTWHIIGLGVFGMLLAMLRGNHVGHVEDWFLIVFAALALVVLIRDLWGRRRGWIR
ncbi:MAG: DUF2631 domain-containing protein [Mycobacterium sp.]|nr:MAG: DUF2631 domain-containing protein [Mycobacterium sp.]